MALDGTPLDFSNWGELYRRQGLLAPGRDIRGALPGGGATTKSGTSFATPVVAGVAALLLSLQIKLDARPSARIVRQGLLQSALGCEHQPAEDCRRLLAGRLNIPGAIHLITKGDVDMTNSLDESIRDPAAPASDESLVTPQSHDAAEEAVNSAPAVPCDRLESPASDTGAEPLVTPSDCGCGGAKNAAPPQKVFALGKLFFDYGTRSRRLYFGQEMRRMFVTPEVPNPPIPNIDDPSIIHRFLTATVDAPYNILNGPQRPNRAKVSALQWILLLDETPIYAIEPTDVFGFEIHDSLVGFLRDQLDAAEEELAPKGSKRKEASVEPKPYRTPRPEVRISVPGYIVGQAQLFTGETVPKIRPDIRGMYSWTTPALTRAAQTEADAPEIAREDLVDFLTRVYDQTRNLGLTSQERALNYAATDALVLQGIFRDARTSPRLRGLELDSFTVTKSPICRPDFDCWDVHVIFYDADNLQRARRAFRFTVDVSDVMPVMIGERKEYSLR